ncbi:large ribosomal subunit processing factor, putative [Plasmodium vivax]|uniref:Uncharacterized protein n=3 Tax=Plasmodium vivax TaxID=5855 RepID=A0A0J9TXF2_PLAVI|nr:hypothetical protein PVIIG_03762 [Plasmodium vivax India VII]KMZ99527.1 hypothetical protein PVNG_02254 [Plasmodium vivax North Korean]CAG9476958.1 unnamed protein product [Plasmodium vivax]SCO72751.1 large ribosomal subunit processing factor, putative [Plasmodium vivax]VUZ95933.1 mediator of RNA polymerase II transcription subunit 21, putative [Plasmodium vivax]
MINNFRSPQSNDPIKKLQNLLNNCLYSVVDVLSNLSYQGEPKELEVVPEEESEYAYFVNLLKERAAEIEREARESEEAMGEVNEEVKEEVKEEVTEEVKEEMKEEIKEGIKEEAKEEITEEAKVEIKEEVKEETKEEAKEEVNEEVKEEIMEKVKDAKDSPAGEAQTDESEDPSSEETSDESYAESSGLSDEQSYDDTMERRETDDEQTQRSVEEGPPKRYFVKPYYEGPLQEEILDRVERMNLILKMIDACIEELPDSLVIEEEKCQEMKALQKRKDDSKEELKRLYSEYDAIYSYVTDNLRDIIINMG